MSVDRGDNRKDHRGGGGYTAEGEKTLFDRVNSAVNEAMLVCIVEGKVAGTCQITWSKGIKTRHRANVAIALLKEYWNQGIGTRMFRELIKIVYKGKICKK